VTPNRDSFAQYSYKQPYAKLTAQQQQSVDTNIRASILEDNPKLDALHAYLGFGGNADYYLVNSLKALTEYQKLRDTYGAASADGKKKYAAKAGAK